MFQERRIQAPDLGAFEKMRIDKGYKIKVKYKKGYKYQLADTITFSVPVFVSQSIDAGYIFLNPKGVLVIYKGYAWDGASGPTYDDRYNMRASLVHDALYQLMRMDLLSKEYREVADHIMYTILLEDGMLRLRAKYYYWAVRKFAGKFADSKNRKKVYEAP